MLRKAEGTPVPLCKRTGHGEPKCNHSGRTLVRSLWYTAIPCGWTLVFHGISNCMDTSSTVLQTNANCINHPISVLDALRLTSKEKNGVLMSMKLKWWPLVRDGGGTVQDLREPRAPTTRHAQPWHSAFGVRAAHEYVLRLGAGLDQDLRDPQHSG